MIWGSAEHVLTVRPATQRSYLNLLNNHLLPVFGELRLTEITYDRIRAYRAEKVRLMDQLRRARERGVRDYLETDEVRLLLEAAARVDNPMRPGHRAPRGGGTTPARRRRSLDQGDGETTGAR